MALLKGCLFAGKITIITAATVACPPFTETGRRLVEIAYRPLSMLVLLVPSFCEIPVLAVRVVFVRTDTDGVPAPAFEIVTAPSAGPPCRLNVGNGTALARLVLSGIRLARRLGVRPL